jgi:putative redox protein
MIMQAMLTTILASTTVHGESGYAQKVTTAGHELAADEPVKRGGTNTGPSPFEIMLASLGACTAITFRMYAERKQWNLGGMDIKLRLLKDGDTQRIERTIRLDGALDSEQQAKLLEIADKTPVTKALAPGIPIHTTLEAGA